MPREIRAGIDVGGTKIVAVLGKGGEILQEVRLERWTRGDWQQDLSVLADTVTRLVEQEGLPLSSVTTLGVTVPGPMDAVAGIVLNPPNLRGWQNVPVRGFLEERLGLPVRIENDANAAALAEWRFGAGRGARHLVFLTMSTGVGGGLILDGQVYNGARYQAGEVGHMPVVRGGRRCACGLRGCLEAYTGGAALASRLRRDVARGKSPMLQELADGDSGRISARTWVEAVRRADPYSQKIFEEYVDHLSRGLAILVMTLDLERIVLGTVIQSNPDLFLEPLQEQLRERVWESHRDVEVRAGELGARLPAYAALCVADLGPRAL